MKLVNQYSEKCEFIIWGHNDYVVSYAHCFLKESENKVYDPPHDKKWDIQVIPNDCPEVWSYDVAHDVEATAWPNFKQKPNSSTRNEVT